MSHILIFRDNFENMALVTITGYSWNYQRQAVINEERTAHSSKGWNYAACYETDNNKTYLVFTREDKKEYCDFCLKQRIAMFYCEHCGIKVKPENSGRLPVYC